MSRSLATALQRVLLPAGLPDVAGWAMAALYEPAGEAVLVGGDFYDWFTLPNGHILFFVGDVSGNWSRPTSCAPDPTPPPADKSRRPSSGEDR